MKLNWGNSLLIFFIIFVSLAAIFIVFSFSQENDLVTDDYYERGADYTSAINLHKRSAIFADSLTFKDDDEWFNILVKPGLANAVEEFNIHFFRPSSKKMDVRFVVESDSLITINKEKLSLGRYKLYVSWTMDDVTYELVRDLMINK